jgi:chlorobactene glucosyltransferase
MNLSFEALADHQTGVIFFLVVLVLVSFSNWLVLQRIESAAARHSLPPRQKLPFVSILVPARNEEDHIAGCVRSLISQDYPEFEILVLDDHSSDRTGSILAELEEKSQRLRVLKSEPLPPGWLGKNWACHQLAQASCGELLLFTDADTRHHPKTLSEAVILMSEEGIDLLTAWPRQEMNTTGERLLVPIVYWSLFNYLPLALAQRTRFPGLVAAIGQYMFFRRTAYDGTGGHAAVRAHAADDVALGRAIKSQGLKWKLFDAGSRVSCRMYQDFHQAYQGFSKNLFAVFDYRLLPFVFVWIWLGIVFLEPPLIVILCLTGCTFLPANLILAGTAVAISLGLWLLTYWRFRVPLYCALFYPLTISLVVLIAFRSLIMNLKGQAAWKGRSLPRPAVRWW